MARLAEDDEAQLASLIEEARAFDAGLLEAMGYDERELDNLLARLDEDTAPSGEDPGADVSRADELQAKWGTELGQVWTLGEHRLMCGDSTDCALIQRFMGSEKARCMWTDPPYGVDYEGKTAAGLTIAHDDAAGLPALLEAVFATANEVLADGAAIYVAHPAGSNGLQFGLKFVGAGWRLHETLIWVKDVMVLGHSDYHYQHEPILYGWKGVNRRWYGGRDQVSVFNVPRPTRSADHPTMKPVELVEAHLRNSSRRGDVVFEPFSGSGTTLIACERLSRRCRAVELLPGYVAVTLERWAEMTGKTPGLEA